MTSIGYKAFFGCNSLPVINNIRYADTYLVGVVDRNCTSATIKTGTKWIGDEAFYECSDLKSVTIGNSVTSIGDGVFYYCWDLTSVILGTRLKSIGQGTFVGCGALKEMVCHSTDFINCDGGAFYDSGYESGTLYVPASLIGAYRTTDPWYNWGSIKTLDDWTADIELPMTNTDAGTIYDLSGRRQSSMRKGINIIGGKKYLAK